MSTPSAEPEVTPQSDEVNRLWQHGMHEEWLFYDRLNYFSAIQVGLLGVFAIHFNKAPAVGVFVPLMATALAFDLLWLRVQVRHWRYSVHVHDRIREAVPEYARTVAAFAVPGRKDGLSISRPLAFAVPLAVRSHMDGAVRLGTRPLELVKHHPYWVVLRRTDLGNHIKGCSCRRCRQGMHTKWGSKMMQQLIRSIGRVV